MTQKEEINNYKDCHPDQVTGFTFQWHELKAIRNQAPSEIDGIGIDLGQDEDGNLTAYAFGKVGKERWIPDAGSLALVKSVKGIPCPDWC